MVTSQNPQDPSKETLIDFPCTFMIKVMGVSDASFKAEMVLVIQKHATEFAEKHVEHRHSSSGKYISLSCSIWVTSKPQLDAIYTDLSAHPLVKYAI